MGVIMWDEECYEIADVLENNSDMAQDMATNEVNGRDRDLLLN